LRRFKRNHRTALEVANGRLEALMGAAYSAVVPLANNYSTYYVDYLTGQWRVSNVDRSETTIVGGRTRPITTTVTYIDADGGSATYDLIRFTVAVQYTDTATDVVRLETMRAQ